MITECRSCHSRNLEFLLSLGDQYLSDFRDDDKKPPKYPLNLVFCTDCFLVQLRETTPQSEMYTPRYGFKSGVNNTIKANLKEIVEEVLDIVPNPSVVIDIGSNDGTLLSFYRPEVYRIGFEPIGKLALESKQFADEIHSDFFNARALEDAAKAQIITTISCFYDMPDPNQFVEDVKAVMDPHGVWSIQQNYLLTTLELSAIDNICHEHIEYYSLLALNNLLARHGLEVFRVETNMINGGCIRTLVNFKGERSIEASVFGQIKKEVDMGLDTIVPYKRFVKEAKRLNLALHDLITDLTEGGAKIYIYGASTRGGTIWQMANLDVTALPKAVERNPEKVGKRIASIGTPIISEEQAREENPEYMLVSPWFFKDEFLEREKEYLDGGGHFIFPLPQVEIV